MKPCPFCAEPIQEAAVKCRFCGSMLAGAPAGGAYLAVPPPAGGLATSTLYDGSPSWKAWFWPYVGAGVLSIVLVGLLWIGYLNLRRKAVRYRITDRTIDTEAGVFSKRIETLQLWRVRHIDFRQSVLERMLDISQIHVYTQDTQEPELVIRGLPASRDLFDRLKDAIELARQQQRVVGVVQ